VGEEESQHSSENAMEEGSAHSLGRMSGGHSADDMLIPMDNDAGQVSSGQSCGAASEHSQNSTPSVADSIANEDGQGAQSLMFLATCCFYRARRRMRDVGLDKGSNCGFPNEGEVMGGRLGMHRCMPEWICNVTPCLWIAYRMFTTTSQHNTVCLRRKCCTIRERVRG